MATIKITDKPSAEAVKDGASVLITQEETVNGAQKEALRKAPLSMLIAALKAKGINTGLVTETALQSMYPDMVKNVTAISTGIRVTFWDDTYTDIEIESGGLAFDSVTYDQESGYLHIKQDGEDVVDPCFIGGGGGGGSVGGTIVSLTNLTGSASMTLAHGSTCNISFSFFDYDSGNELTNSNGNLEVYVNGTVVISKSITQGNHTINVTSYLQEGTNKVKVKVTDEDENYATKTWTINSISLSVSATFDETAINSGAVVFRYTPIGNNISKTMHFKIDGAEIATATVTTSGRQQTQSIPAQTHGAHKLECYATATVDGVNVQSNTLTFDIIWAAEGNSTPIIACSYTGGAEQYSNVAIPFIVYNPASLTASITLAVDGTTVSTQTVDRTTQTWNYRPTASGIHTLTITCGSVTKTISLTVTGSGISVDPITTGLVLDLDPHGHTNNDNDKTSFGYVDQNSVNHPLTFSQNFDWSNGGFKQDDDGNTALVIKAGTTVTVGKQLFSDDAMRNGKEIKMIFKATNCRSYTAQIASCMVDNIGMTLNAQSATVKSEQTSVEVQYCEDTRIEMDINIEPDSADRAMMVWLEGIPSIVAIYEENDNFTQDSPANLVIGSNDCDVWIYRIKAYENDLTRLEIHENWIADAPSAEEMIARYNNNNIFDQNGNIDIQKLIVAAPNLHIIELSGPRMTTGKSDAVVGDIVHTYGAGGNAKKFTASGVKYKVQGTSSAAYGEAAYNLDLDFSAVTQWKDGTGADMTEWKFNDNSIGINYINLKLNVASSECANNCIIQSEYNDFQPYINPARQANSKVRDTMYGEPMVIFFTNTSNETIRVSSRDLAPGETMLYGVGDMMNSKKNKAVFGQSSENANQCCIEISNNTNNQCLFKSDDISEPWDGDHSFEFRHCGGDEETLKNAWKRVLTWVKSTDTTTATNNTLPQPVTYAGTAYTTDTEAYRLAKFKAEYQDYFIKDSLLYHYLFTERHALVDNRAKNIFVSTDDAVHWDFTKDYDNDTADGNDNEGGLTLTYGLEDIDTIGTKSVFNASDSVLWKNVRTCLYEELRTLYLTLEGQNAWNAERILTRYKNHQSARPQALVIEDMWQKYIIPYTNGGTDAYLKMMLGTKEDQRRQFETYQEKYCASKYRGTKASSDAITFRAYTPTVWGGVEPGDEITITTYADMYITLVSGSGIVTQRATRGTAYTIECPIDTLNDTEIYIYSASNISSVGDLAPLYVGYFNIANAVKLRSLKLGDGTSGYSNTNANSITVGNNTLLESIDIRNCPNIVQGLNLTNCPALTTLEAAGSGITGVSFARGGNVTTAHLPAIVSFSAIALKALTSLTFAGYTALRTARIEDCPTIDVEDFLESATGLTRARIIGINWTLEDTDLLDALVALKGLDESDHNLDQSVLAGSVSVPIMRQSKLTAYQTAWGENLTISYDTLVQQYIVTFKNWDGTTLCTEYVDRGEDAPNPISEGIINTPSRAETAAYSYSFDGWDVSLAAVVSARTITATFTATPQQYTVRWIANGAVLQTSTVGYGSEGTYNGSTPTRNSEEGQYIYNVFSGWDKSTGFITGNTDVNAVWERKELPQVGADTEPMTAAEFFGLIQAGYVSRLSLKDRVKITLGWIPTFSNVQYTDVATNLILNGATIVDTNVQPLLDINNAWTVVLDTEIWSSTAGQTILCCYQEEGAMGFKVTYNGGNVVTWGTATKNCGGELKRQDMIVLRHEAGSRNLKVYASNFYGTSITTETLTKAIDTQSNVHLYVGGTKIDNGDVGDYATGIIRKCRVYHGDLGDTDCRKIANAPLEWYWFEVGQFGAYRLTSSSVTPTSVDFICASLLKKTMQMNTQNSNAGGFSAMPLYTWLSTRFYNALPQSWRSIIKQCRVNHNNYVNGSQSNVQTSNMYVWLPCGAEMNSNSGSAPWSQEGTPITYFTSDATRVAYTGYATRDGYTAFSQATDPTLDQSNNVQAGDQWCDTSNSNKYYIFDGFTWQERTAAACWLRGAAVSYSNGFGTVYSSGTVSPYSYGATTQYGVRPRFSI